MNKIIQVKETKQQKENPKKTDLIHVIVESSDGAVSWSAYMFRPHLELRQQMEKMHFEMGIPEETLDRLMKLASQSYELDHRYDNEE